MSNPDFLSGQPDKRRAMRFTDQHGRKWTGSIELDSGLPSGPIRPFDFEPPLPVPQEFIEYNKLEPNNIRINYAKWLAALEEAKRRWEQKLINRAERMYGDQAGKYIKNPSQELLAAVGPEPLPPEPVQAAASGNKWVLGLTPVKPGWAKAFFPDDKPLRPATRTRAVQPIEEDVEEWKDQFPDADEPEDDEEE